MTKKTSYVRVNGELSQPFKFYAQKIIKEKVEVFLVT